MFKVVWGDDFYMGYIVVFIDIISKEMVYFD